MSTLQNFDALGVGLERMLLIEASAGTGKTFTIAALYLRLVLERQLRPDQILVVTFTEAATAELRGRLRQRLAEARLAFEQGDGGDDPLLCGLLDRCAGDAEAQRRATRRLEAALLGFDEAAVFTIHGFCHRALAEHAFAAGADFDAELLADQDSLLQAVVEDYWRRTLYAAQRRIVAHALNRGLSPAALAAELRGWLGKPWLQLLDVPGVDYASAEAAFDAALQAAQALWAPEALAAELAGAGLKANIYRPATLTALLAEVDAWLAAATPELPQKFELLTPAKLAASLKKGGVCPQHAFFAAAAALMTAAEALGAALDNELVRLRRGLFEFAVPELHRRKREAGVLSYDDLLSGLAVALAVDGAGARLAEGLRRRYPAALIDEFQDTDPTQYAIFKAIYHGHELPVCCVGDPKHAIYSFRGADVFAYLAARDDAPQRHTLTVNWRSRPPLIAALNALFSQRCDPFLLPGIDYVPVQPKPDEPASLQLPDGDAALHLWWCGSDDGKPVSKAAGRAAALAATAGRIAELLSAGRRGRASIAGRALGGGDIAVLVRTHAQAMTMRDALLERGVPSVLHSPDSVFATAEALQLERLLAAVLDPRHEPGVRAALASDLLGVDAAGLLALAEDEARWEALIGRLQGLHERWAERGFAPMFRALLTEFDIAERLLDYRDGERRLANLLHLGELLAEFDSTGGGMEALLVQLAQARTEGAIEDESRQMRLESDAARVQIVTIHKSKGLEYPIVFCPLLWDLTVWGAEDASVRYHDPEASGRLLLDLAPAQGGASRRQAVEEELAEQLRLAYVALTRARERLYLIWGAYSGAERSPLAWLLHPQNFGSAEQWLACGLDRGRPRQAWIADAALQQALESLRQCAPTAIRIEPLPPAGTVFYPPAEVDAATLNARPFSRYLSPGRRTGSFSQLLAGWHDEGRDVDAVRPPPLLEPAADDFLHFPAGPEPGTCLHDILEHVDFAGDDAAIAAVAGDWLRRRGLDAERWLAAAVSGIGHTLRTPLTADGLRLCSLPAAARRAEMEFFFPVEKLTADGLVALGARYGWALPKLDFAALHGYLHGYIDLVFQHRGQVWIVDYKSNRLGLRIEDYAAERLGAAMDAAGYRLQYLLYSVAVVRWMRQRVPGWDYARDFGGVLYLFLRGLDPALGPTHGVFADRPDAAFIAAFDHWLQHGTLPEAA